MNPGRSGVSDTVIEVEDEKQLEVKGESDYSNVSDSIDQLADQLAGTMLNSVGTNCAICKEAPFDPIYNCTNTRCTFRYCLECRATMEHKKPHSTCAQCQSRFAVKGKDVLNAYNCGIGIKEYIAMMAPPPVVPLTVNALSLDMKAYQQPLPDLEAARQNFQSTRNLAAKLGLDPDAPSSCSRILENRRKKTLRDYANLPILDNQIKAMKRHEEAKEYHRECVEQHKHRTQLQHNFNIDSSEALHKRERRIAPRLKRQRLDYDDDSDEYDV